MQRTVERGLVRELTGAEDESLADAQQIAEEIVDKAID